MEAEGFPEPPWNVVLAGGADQIAKALSLDQ